VLEQLGWSASRAGALLSRAEKLWFHLTPEVVALYGAACDGLVQSA
jgi:hypothetical protein